MLQSIKSELTDHLRDMVLDGAINEDNFEDAHNIAFNEDYYVIYYSDALAWLKKHRLDNFEAIGICQEYEEENFGECSTVYDDPAKVVNMLAYIYGEQVIPYTDSWEDFKEELECG